MRFGKRVQELRSARSLSQRVLGQLIDVSHTYVSKIENGKLDFGEYPSEELIMKIAAVLEADQDELLLLARKIPSQIRKRIFERPDAFLKLAQLNDDELDRVLDDIGDTRSIIVTRTAARGQSHRRQQK
ncbi:MAG: helix-turn-helix domain-containing protein [Planctomycetota bacterium]